MTNLFLHCLLSFHLVEVNGVRASTIPQTLLKPKRQTGTPTMDESHSPNISVFIKFDSLDPLILALKESHLERILPTSGGLMVVIH